MRIKTILLFIFWSTLLWSCREVTFPVPQPVGVTPLRTIPEKLYGHYLSYDQKNGERSDTLIIESWGYQFKDKDDKDWLGKGVLSDSLILKSYKGYYFVNFLSGNQWFLRVLKKNPSGSISFLSIELKNDTITQEVVGKISKKLKVKEITKDSDKFYQINPTPSQLMELIKEGYFTGAELSKVK